MRKYAVLFLIFILSIQATFISGQQIKEMEFKNQLISDILLALGEMSGNSILIDETVSGSASYYFTETDFDTALTLFLSNYKLYYWIDQGVYHISKVKTDFDEESGTVSLNAENVALELLVKNLSKATGKTILNDSLPRENITIHINNIPLEKAISIIIRKYPDYKLETDNDFFYIKREELSKTEIPDDFESGKSFYREDDKYNLKLKSIRFQSLIKNLFTDAELEYVMMIKSDVILENLYYADKTFNSVLMLILDQVNGDYQVKDNIYYIFEIQRTDVMKKLKQLETIPLKYISVSELTGLFPQGLAAHTQFKVDEERNSVILYGSEKEIFPIREFISSIDKPQDDTKYYRFDIKFSKVKDFIGYLPVEYKNLKPVIVSETNSFLLKLNSERADFLEKYISMIDRGNEAIPIKLKYIKAEDFIKNLPPTVSKDDIIQTVNDSVVFLKASDEKSQLLLQELEIIDQPVPQIRYELLVVQYQDSQKNNWNSSLENSKVADQNSSDYVLIGQFDKLLSLNFDIVSTFGYQFASKLSYELSDNSARVLADTTLNGLSGEEISFQNTNTYRYRDFEIDPDTGQTKSTGVTRELSSGLMIKVKGWISGDGMITMDVDSTISKQGTDVSGTSTDPPPTSEKVIGTLVRSESGNPVIIGGLLQKDLTVSYNYIPVISKIPLIGALFKDKNESEEITELVIYIVPHLEYPEEDSISIGKKVEQLYMKFLKSGL